LKKFKTQPSAGKLMLTILWDSQGHVLEAYLECGTVLRSATYCDMLQSQLKPALCSRRERDRVRPVFARQCPSPYCCPHVGNPWEIEVGSHGASSSQSILGEI
jgi:hypothetical protein